MNQFNAYTPLYHEALDNWGIGAGTHIWDASGNFVNVKSVKPGDMVFGITFRKEDEYINRVQQPDNPTDNIVKAWRPILCAREILAVDTVQARSWQLTFGDSEKLIEARRLVAGADTFVGTFPLTNEIDFCKRMVDMTTAVENPRTKTEFRKALQIDGEASQNAGKVVYRETPYSGQPRGDLATIIPFDIYGGQTNMLRRDIRPYHRYLYTQVREVVPIQETTTLYQIYVKGDTSEERAVVPGKIRCNLIAQTPFAPDKKNRTIFTSELASQLNNIKDPDKFLELCSEWDTWVKQGTPAKTNEATSSSEHSSHMQGSFYDKDLTKGLENKYGMKGGYLNGGILINVPPISVRGKQ